MSQEKVDRYKEYKKNRKDIIEKEKKQKQRSTLLWKILGAVLALGIVAALGITVYNAIRNSVQAAPDYNRDSMIVQDVVGLWTTEAPTTEAASTEAASTEASSTENPGTQAPESETAPTEASSSAAP